MQKITLLGFSAETVPIVVDVAFDMLGVSNFQCIKNIPLAEPNVPFRSEWNTIDVVDHTDKNWLNRIEALQFGVSNSEIKKAVFDFFNKEYGLSSSNFINLIHPHSYVSKTVSLQKGILVEPGCVLSSFAEIGFGVSIKRCSSVGHHNKIGNFVNINPGVTISGKVSIGEGTTVGSGSVVIDNVQIGSNSIIGVGSVVTKNIPSNVIAFGNPCKVLRERDK
jgi:sugar O-acyltransferase (sialic acid O-acetyltransferase NeuD family)